MLQILSAFFSAFFGAAAAFASNHIAMKLRERKTQLSTINRTVYLLIITLEKLANLKRQFLVEHHKEFSEALEVLSESDPTGPPHSIKRTGEHILQIFHTISVTDPTLNGAFKVWQELDFLPVGQIEELSFTVSASPELLRLLILVASETGQISKRIALRNARRELLTGGTIEEAQHHEIGARTILFWHEMLDFRRILLFHVDTALIASYEALERLSAYRTVHFRRQNKLFRLITGPEHWTTYAIPDKWKSLVPDRNKYDDVLGPATPQHPMPTKQ